MKSLTLTGFMNLSKNIKRSSYEFCSWNQRDELSGTIGWSMKFDEVSIMRKPNRIILKNKSGFLSLAIVRSIEYKEVGDKYIFEISCTSFNLKGEDRKDTYIIIADKKNEGNL